MNSFRFGYHSLSRFFIGREYAEDETEETGWNSFEARIACADTSAYDPVIGRWLSVDPARQFASPYVGMGNNPVIGVDPDGRFWEEFWNWIGTGRWITNDGARYLKENPDADFMDGKDLD